MLFNVVKSCLVNVTLERHYFSLAQKEDSPSEIPELSGDICLSSTCKLLVEPLRMYLVVCLEIAVSVPID